MTDNVLDFQRKMVDQLAVTGELAFLVCPVCKDQHAPMFPIIGVNARDKRAFVANLMCVSAKCNGNTVFDVDNGFISEAVRILEDEN